MRKEELRERYEATGDPATFEEAQRLYEQALAANPDDPRTRFEYGYLLECHGRDAIRQAATQYEHAIELDPTWTKVRLQLIFARAALHEAHEAIALYEHRLKETPDDRDERRCLATAYLAANAYEKASAIVDAALARSPDDPVFLELRGDVRAGTGRTDEALADWRAAHELDPENLSSIYSSAFLLQREGRVEEAEETWAYIIDWCEARGYASDAKWPRSELERLRCLREATVDD